jgi:hypothetical protein
MLIWNGKDDVFDGIAGLPFALFCDCLKLRNYSPATWSLTDLAEAIAAGDRCVEGVPTAGADESAEAVGTIGSPGGAWIWVFHAFSVLKIDRC